MGLKKKSEATLGEREPNKETHPEYDIIYGPFRSTEDVKKFVKAMGAGVACREG